jgi:hypothetical protein
MNFLNRILFCKDDGDKKENLLWKAFGKKGSEIASDGFFTFIASADKLYIESPLGRQYTIGPFSSVSESKSHVKNKFDAAKEREEEERAAANRKESRSGWFARADFTKGPWQIGNTNMGPMPLFACEPFGYVPGILFPAWENGISAVAAANMRLASASPELHLALREVFDDASKIDSDEWRQRVLSIFIKVRGEPPPEETPPHPTLTMCRPE